MYSPGIGRNRFSISISTCERRSPAAAYFELSALLAAREFDQQYEWSGHEPAAVRAGLEPSVIDVVKFNRDVAGLPEKDATVIRLGSRAVPRSQGELGAVGEDGRVLRTPGRRRDRGDDGRLRDGGISADGRRSAAAAGTEAAVACEIAGWWLLVQPPRRQDRVRCAAEFLPMFSSCAASPK